VSHFAESSRLIQTVTRYYADVFVVGIFDSQKEYLEMQQSWEDELKNCLKKEGLFGELTTLKIFCVIPVIRSDTISQILVSKSDILKLWKSIICHGLLQGSEIDIVDKFLETVNAPSEEEKEEKLQNATWKTYDVFKENFEINIISPKTHVSMRYLMVRYR
jgi:hypothetical protein